MERLVNTFFNNLKYLCLVGIITLGVIAIVGCNGEVEIIEAQTSAIEDTITDDTERFGKATFGKTTFQ